SFPTRRSSDLFPRAARPLRLDRVGASGDPALLVRSVPVRAPAGCPLNLLITGGCGYVGTKLTEAVLARTPHHVTVLDTMWFGNHLPPDPRLTVRAMGGRPTAGGGPSVDEAI